MDAPSIRSLKGVCRVGLSQVSANAASAVTSVTPDDCLSLGYHHERNIGIIGRQCRHTSKEGEVWTWD